VPTFYDVFLNHDKPNGLAVLIKYRRVTKPGDYLKYFLNLRRRRLVSCYDKPSEFLG